MLGNGAVSLGHCLARFRGEGVGELWRLHLRGRDTEGQGAKRHATHACTRTRTHTPLHPRLPVNASACTCTHVPLHTHRRAHVNINTRTCMHTLGWVLTEKFLRGASWAPRTWQREPRCQWLLSSPESQFGKGQPSSWQGRRASSPRPDTPCASAMHHCLAHSSTQTGPSEHRGGSLQPLHLLQVPGQFFKKCLHPPPHLLLFLVFFSQLFLLSDVCNLEKLACQT